MNSITGHAILSFGVCAAACLIAPPRLVKAQETLRILLNETELKLTPLFKGLSRYEMKQLILNYNDGAVRKAFAFFSKEETTPNSRAENVLALSTALRVAAYSSVAFISGCLVSKIVKKIVDRSQLTPQSKELITELTGGVFAACMTYYLIDSQSLARGFLAPINFSSVVFLRV